MKFLFITDTHITSSCPIRTGDPVQDCLDKLQHVIDRANELGAIILHGGDFFDKSTVPYEVFNKVVSVLKTVKTEFYIVRGNHDQLYRSDDNNYKTSLESLIQIGIIKEIITPIEFSDCIITSDPKLVNNSKPQILVFHGFLNTKDGKHTFQVEDIAGCTTPAIVLLGHDHVEYEPVSLGTVTVYRPGSFFRNRRIESNDRNPKYLEITVSNGKFTVKDIPVICRPTHLIFRETSGKASLNLEGDYSDLITELKSVGSEQSDFMGVVRQISNPEISDYIENLLSMARVNTVR